MNGRRAVTGLALICALAIAAIATPSAQAGTTMYTCVQQPSGQFTEAHCAANGHNDGKTYNHAAFVGTTSFVGTNLKANNTTTESAVAVLKGTVAGVSVEISCTSTNSSGSLTNENVESNMRVSGLGKTEVSNCTVNKPTKCLVKEPIAASVNGQSFEEGEAMGVEFTPSEGETLAEISFLNKGAEKCSLANGGKPFPVTGSVRATFSGALTEVTAAHSKLKLGGNTATFSAKSTWVSQSNETPLSPTTTNPEEDGALKWTDIHKEVKADDHIAQTFKGFVYMESAGTTLFGCETEVEITIKGPETGKVVDYKPLTKQCIGFGSFDCELESHSHNIPEGWVTKTTTTGVQVEPEKAGKSLTVKFVFKNTAKCKAPKLELHSVLNKIILTPKFGKNTTIDSFKVSSTSGGSPTLAGELNVDTPEVGTLGLA